MIEKNLTGTGIAMVTPFHKDESIDFKSLEKLIEHLIANNADYLVVLDIAGEANTLSNDEHNAVTNFVIEITDKRLPVVAGIGGNNTQEIINRIKENDFEGIDAILSVAPYYYNTSQKGIFQHYKTIASACPVPIILYNVPNSICININAETTLKLANEFKNIVAIKEASGNFGQIMHILKHKPDDFLVISGDDAVTLPLISLGVSGAISVVANAFPKDYSNMVREALKGNYKTARTIHYNLIEIIDTLSIEGNAAGIKAALSILDIIPNNLRLPLYPVSKSTYLKLSKLIEEFNKK